MAKRILHHRLSLADHRRLRDKAARLSLLLASKGCIELAQMIASLGVHHAQEARAHGPKPAYLSRVMSLGLPFAIPTRDSAVAMVSTPVIGFALGAVLVVLIARCIGVVNEAFVQYRNEKALRDAARHWDDVALETEAEEIRRHAKARSVAVSRAEGGKQ